MPTSRPHSARNDKGLQAEALYMKVDTRFHVLRVA
jgi:hypothetical protein